MCERVYVGVSGHLFLSGWELRVSSSGALGRRATRHCHVLLTGACLPVWGWRACQFGGSAGSSLGGGRGEQQRPSALSPQKCPASATPVLDTHPPPWPCQTRGFTHAPTSPKDTAMPQPDPQMLLSLCHKLPAINSTGTAVDESCWSCHRQERPAALVPYQPRAAGTAITTISHQFCHHR